MALSTLVSRFVALSQTEQGARLEQFIVRLLENRLIRVHRLLQLAVGIVAVDLQQARALSQMGIRGRLPSPKCLVWCPGCLGAKVSNFCVLSVSRPAVTA